jgi:hypothetical protein
VQVYSVFFPSVASCSDNNTKYTLGLSVMRSRAMAPFGSASNDVLIFGFELKQRVTVVDREREDWGEKEKRKIQHPHRVSVRHDVSAFESICVERANVVADGNSREPTKNGATRKGTEASLRRHWVFVFPHAQCVIDRTPRWSKYCRVRHYAYAPPMAMSDCSSGFRSRAKFFCTSA